MSSRITRSDLIAFIGWESLYKKWKNANMPIKTMPQYRSDIVIKIESNYRQAKHRNLTFAKAMKYIVYHVFGKSDFSIETGKDDNECILYKNNKIIDKFIDHNSTRHNTQQLAIAILNSMKI